MNFNALKIILKNLLKKNKTDPGPGFTKILKLMLKLRHIISVFVSREIMLKLVFSKVISGENKVKLSLYVSKHFIG